MSSALSCKEKNGIWVLKYSEDPQNLLCFISYDRILGKGSRWINMICTCLGWTAV